MLYTDAAEDDRQAMLIAGKRALEQASTELATKTDLAPEEITATVNVDKLLEGKAKNRPVIPGGGAFAGAGGMPRVPPHLLGLALPRAAAPAPIAVPAAVRQAHIAPPVQQAYGGRPAPRIMPGDFARHHIPNAARAVPPAPLRVPDTILSK